MEVLDYSNLTYSKRKKYYALFKFTFWWTIGMLQISISDGAQCIDGKFDLASSVKGLHRRFTHSSFDGVGKKWNDLSSYAIPASFPSPSAPFTTCESGNGASASICYVQGTTSETINFGPNSIPSTFTICSVSRYTAAFNQDRILSARSGFKWIHGHHIGLAGVAYYGSDGYRSHSPANATSPNTNWLIVCGENASPDRVYANGVDVTVGAGGDGGGNMEVNVDGNPSN
jgi:hypothetical protein